MGKITDGISNLDAFPDMQQNTMSVTEATLAMAERHVHHIKRGWTFVNDEAPKYK
jgi:hypothetical protein